MTALYLSQWIGAAAPPHGNHRRFTIEGRSSGPWTLLRFPIKILRLACLLACLPLVQSCVRTFLFHRIALSRLDLSHLIDPNSLFDGFLAWTSHNLVRRRIDRLLVSASLLIQPDYRTAVRSPSHILQSLPPVTAFTLY